MYYQNWLHASFKHHVHAVVNYKEEADEDECQKIEKRALAKKMIIQHVDLSCLKETSG
jgi:hypothetical protein